MADLFMVWFTGGQCEQSIVASSASGRQEVVTAASTRMHLRMQIA